MVSAIMNLQVSLYTCHNEGELFPQDIIVLNGLPKAIHVSGLSDATQEIINYIGSDQLRKEMSRSSTFTCICTSSGDKNCSHIAKSFAKYNTFDLVFTLHVCVKMDFDICMADYTDVVDLHVVQQLSFTWPWCC